MVLLGNKYKIKRSGCAQRDCWSDPHSWLAKHHVAYQLVYQTVELEKESKSLRRAGFH